MILEWSDRKHMIEHPSNRTAPPLKMLVSAESFGAAINRTIHGSMKKGVMMLIVRRTPYKIGKVKHSSALSPATSEKSFVTEAPKRYRAKIPPISKPRQIHSHCHMMIHQVLQLTLQSTEVIHEQLISLKTLSLHLLLACPTQAESMMQ